MARCKDWGTKHDHAHGTTCGWGYHGCRCTDCEQAHYSLHRARDRERAKSAERRAWVREFVRTKRREGNPVYANHGNGQSHRRSGWSAQRAHRESNRPSLNAAARVRAERIRTSVRAERKPWCLEDIALITRDDILLTEMAYLIGRTPAAIAQQRYRIRKEQAA
jgi:hypothetical protein